MNTHYYEQDYNTWCFCWFLERKLANFKGLVLASEKVRGNNTESTLYVSRLASNPTCSILFQRSGPNIQIVILSLSALKNIFFIFLSLYIHASYSSFHQKHLSPK